MSTATAPAMLAPDAAVYRRVAWRIIPFLFVAYIIAFLDRVNVGYAKLQMAADLNRHQPSDKRAGERLTREIPVSPPDTSA